MSSLFFANKTFFSSLLSCACRLIVVCFLALPSGAHAQQTNPVDRQVTNPITDTPSVNPTTQEQPIRPRQAVQAPDGSLPSNEQLDIDADSEVVTGTNTANNRVVVYEGNVDAHIGVYRLQTDKLTVYTATNRVIAEGNVVFDQRLANGTEQRITGTRAEFNYATKLGFFLNSTGYTNQTQDGTIIYFTADRVEKVSLNRIVAFNAQITACDENVPKWSFNARQAEITLNDRVRIKRPTFRVKGIPILALPFASISIKRRDRASGFLTPTFSGSGNKGFRLSNSYYQTLGRSADITFRNDIYTARGVGFGADLRTRANSRSFFDMGFFAVKDRLFGPKASDVNPDQGGSSFYARGVQYFPNGFLAVADVNITSNLTFRQVFSDRVQLAISPIERSQVFVNRNFGNYGFNLLASSDVVTIPSTRIRTRQLPGIIIERRPSVVERFKRLPVYFSFQGGLEGVSRKETITDLAAFEREGVPNAIVTPSIVQRLDLQPKVSVPLNFGGWSLTAMGTARATYYSNSLDPQQRLVTSRDIIRSYGQFEFDVRPPALARNFYRSDNSFRFRHAIEPYLIYRLIKGVGDNFDRIIRFDERDTVANTNEIEFGITNRFWTRRSTENVGNRATEAAGEGEGSDANKTSNGDRMTLASQPYEALSVTVRAKYFFDPTFGGALVPGRRNQFYPINTFSGFTYGGVPRTFSPVNVNVRFRPRETLFADTRLNFDVSRTNGVGLRDLAVSFGLDRPLVKAFQTFYYTRAVTLAPSLAQFSDLRGNEPGTLQGSQWSPSLFVGNTESGLFGGVSFFFDFRNTFENGDSTLRSSTVTAGYAFDCCAITTQYASYNFGLRRENRFVFSFRLNGIGTFGTEQFAQQFR
ncbi:MAG: LPS assembly protein LptD [Pyrinomonadaceae bacterium]|nr:LPS assembly protein LptD [Pyrinomonadaceae bacterium]